MDKSSTLFVHVFEGEEIAIFDFHKPEWRGRPECLVDPGYVWTVDGDGHHVGRFCEWLSTEVMKRVSSAVAEAYRWPLPGDPRPTPPAPPRPAPKAVAPRVRARSNQPAAPPIDAHRRRTLALQAALDEKDPLALAELASDLSRLSPAARSLATWLGREPELSEGDVRARLGGDFERASAELDDLLRGLD